MRAGVFNFIRARPKIEIRRNPLYGLKDTPAPVRFEPYIRMYLFGHNRNVRRFITQRIKPGKLTTAYLCPKNSPYLSPITAQQP